MFTVTLNASPSVVLDGSSEVESPPRPNTNVLGVFDFSPSLSLLPSFLSPSPDEQAASAVDRTSTSNRASDHNLLLLIKTPPSVSVLYHRRLLHHKDGKRQSDRIHVEQVVELLSYKHPFCVDT